MAMIASKDAGPLLARRRWAGSIFDTLTPSRIAVPAFLLFWSLLVILPLCVMVAFSFFEVKFYRVVYEPTLVTWQSMIESGRWLVTLRTLRIALTMTVVEFLLAFPFALWLAKGCRSKTTKAVIITLLTIPFFLDASSRIIVWRSILGTNGAINSALMYLGIIDAPIEWLLYSEFAVHFGLLGTHFPTMVFPIFMSISLIDDDFLQASQDLGASPAQTLLNVILPLAAPGIIAGIVFTFVPLMAAFVEPQLLGGGFVDLLGNSVESALAQLRYPTAAALTTVVIVLLGLCLWVLVRVMRRYGDVATMFVAIRR
jgi:spermidine/putrescine transport system permease protein